MQRSRCVGGRADNFPTPEEYERVSYTFTINAANFLCKVVESQVMEVQTDRPAQPFRFCYCSTKWADREGTARTGLFSFEAESRIMKVCVNSCTRPIDLMTPCSFF